MFRTRRFLIDCQRAPEQRPGVVMAALLLVMGAQIVQGLRDVGMPGSQRPLTDRQRPLEQRLSFGVALLALIERREIV
jgi:hypothetical protein